MPEGVSGEGPKEHNLKEQMVKQVLDSVSQNWFRFQFHYLQACDP